ncbi:MAG: polyprenyl synthetase family protein [Coprobacter sp.]|nr:polyprenyl synthetase family protein [Coprobacter sp.]
MHKLQDLLPVVQQALDAIDYPQAPAELYTPIQYELSLGGKRIRPVLTLMACEMFGCDYHYALDAAVGIEMFHNFTLLHDDVMDKADMRRGKPTVHIRWNENTAILSGDAMQILAYMQVMKSPAAVRDVVCVVFLQTALEICEGQQYDMEFETRQDVREEEYIEMIRLKTAVLLGGALKIGALIAGASDDDARRLYDFGINIGLAFQLRDDYLDVYGDAKTFGKNIGGDILNNKKTYMLINAQRLAQGAERDELIHWLAIDDKPDEKIAAVTALYNRLGVDALCLEKIDTYYAEAMKQLDALSVEKLQTEMLRELAMSLMQRNS